MTFPGCFVFAFLLDERNRLSAVRWSHPVLLSLIAFCLLFVTTLWEGVGHCFTAVRGSHLVLLSLIALHLNFVTAFWEGVEHRFSTVWGSHSVLLSLVALHLKFVTAFGEGEGHHFFAVHLCLPLEATLCSDVTTLGEGNGYHSLALDLRCILKAPFLVLMLGGTLEFDQCGAGCMAVVGKAGPGAFVEVAGKHFSTRKFADSRRVP